jgi:2-methylcitrate dehydratase
VSQPGEGRRPDELVLEVATYVESFVPERQEAWRNAHLVLFDSLACALLALEQPACTRHLGPVVAGTVVPQGARVPGTGDLLDPVKAAWDTGALIRWLDFNDTWLAAEWGHPSDNLGAILAVADHLSRRAATGGGAGPTVRDVLVALVKAHEIQGVLSLTNSLNAAGLDHVFFVRLASTAVAAHLLGASRHEIASAVTNAVCDGGSLRAYRQAPNTGQRKSWAAGDATARGVFLALLAGHGEPGYPTALSAPRWGFAEVGLGGRQLELSRPLASYIVENVLFKVAFPAEFHAQTAVEAALRLHDEVARRLDEVAHVEIDTQSAGARIIDKTGPLTSPADRDHCIQYMVAVALIFGELRAEHYQDDVARDPRIDALRQRMVVREEQRFSADYLDPSKRSIGNAVRVVFADGSATKRVEVEYPLGHPRRRAEAEPSLVAKLDGAVRAHLPPGAADRVLELRADPEAAAALPVHDLMDLLVAQRK